MNDIALEFENFLDWLRTQPYRIVDAYVNLKASPEKHNVFVLLDQPEITQEIRQSEIEADKQLTNIVKMVVESNLLNLSICLLISNLSGIYFQFSYNYTKGFTKFGYLCFAICSGFALFTSTQVFNYINFDSAFKDLRTGKQIEMIK